MLKLKASAGPLTIGDSKEGFLAMRVAATMRADRQNGGHFVNSLGDADGKAWSKRADWVDYYGPVDGETVGIAILSHPDSYSPQPRWHVREYGLFAANTFGEIAFTNGRTDVRKRPLRKALAAGESLLFRYRIILHQGDEQQAKIAAEFQRFAKEPVNLLLADEALESSDMPN